jgi:hypothetical protein
VRLTERVVRLTQRVVRLMKGVVRITVPYYIGFNSFMFKGSIQPSNASYSSPTDGDLRRLAKRYLYLHVRYATGRVICFDTARRFPLEIGLLGNLVS